MDYAALPPDAACVSLAVLQVAPGLLGWKAPSERLILTNKYLLPLPGLRPTAFIFHLIFLRAAKTLSAGYGEGVSSESREGPVEPLTLAGSVRVSHPKAWRAPVISLGPTLELTFNKWLLSELSD